MSVAWYWFRTLGAARRTQSSFNVFLSKTNPSDLSVILSGPNLTSDLARLPLGATTWPSGGVAALAATPQSIRLLPAVANNREREAA
jgi:hypothetical protein